VKLKDPYPNFIPLWTHAVEFVHKHCKKEIIQKQKELTKNLGGRTSIETAVIELIHDKFNLRYHQHGACLVGEAHRFDASYESGKDSTPCGECSGLSYSPSIGACKSIKALYTFKRKLMTHFKRDHAPLAMIGKCKK